MTVQIHSTAVCVSEMYRRSRAWLMAVKRAMSSSTESRYPESVTVQGPGDMQMVMHHDHYELNLGLMRVMRYKYSSD
jgi:hypothetical protein